MTTPTCQRCNAAGELRTLRIDCMARMTDPAVTRGVSIPFDIEHIVSQPNHVFYTLRICKACREGWLTAFSHWFKYALRPGGRISFDPAGQDHAEAASESWHRGLDPEPDSHGFGVLELRNALRDMVVAVGEFVRSLPRPHRWASIRLIEADTTARDLLAGTVNCRDLPREGTFIKAAITSAGTHEEMTAGSALLNRFVADTGEAWLTTARDETGTGEPAKYTLWLNSREVDEAEIERRATYFRGILVGLKYQKELQ